MNNVHLLCAPMYRRVAHPSDSTNLGGVWPNLRFGKPWGCPTPRFFLAKGGRAQTSTSHQFFNPSVKMVQRFDPFPKSEPAHDQRFEFLAHPCSPIPLQRVN